MIQGFTIKTIDDKEITNKRVLLRVDYNLPRAKDGSITDDSRMKATIPTIESLLKHKNRLIIVTYLGRPKGRDPQFSLKGVTEKLQEHFPDYKIILVDDFLTNDSLLAGQKDNEIAVLENIRFYKEEKANDPEFAKKLALYGDIYVTDAFAQMHRTEASIVGVPQILPSYAGLLLKKEIEMLVKVTKNPQKPLVAILGGAKISTKIGLISSIMKIADYILVGGGIANTFLAAKGYAMGKSLVEKETIEMAKKMLADFEISACRLVLPDDAVCGDVSNNSFPSEIRAIDRIPDSLAVLDIGPNSEKEYNNIIQRGKTIVWNGPVGLFENPHYRHGTDAIYNSIVATKNAVTILGGGDTIAAIADKKENSNITHISTGGGAMLEFIEKGTLPGITALESVIHHERNPNNMTRMHP